MGTDRLSLPHILALLQAESAGFAEDLASLAISLFVYETALHCALLIADDPDRSIPLALHLVRQLGWKTQRHCLAKGHDQAERYGFFLRQRQLTTLTGNKRTWKAAPFQAAWHTFRETYLVSLSANPSHVELPPTWLPPGQTAVRNVYDFRTLVLWTLFELHARTDTETRLLTWHISREELAALIGVSVRSLDTYLDRARLADSAGHAALPSGQQACFIPVISPVPRAG